MDLSQKYQAVIGLEVHAQLATNSKLFSGDSIAFGNAPNTQVSPIALAHPGSLPKLNQKAIEYSVKMGLACNCTIAEESFLQEKIISILIFLRVTKSLSIRIQFVLGDL